jgi:hypothetical protein
MLPDCEMKPMSPGLDVAQVEQVHVLVQVEHARGVGADDAHAARTRGVQHLLLELAPSGAGLAEAAGEDHRALHALAPALGQQPGRVFAGVQISARSTGPGMSSSEA